MHLDAVMANDVEFALKGKRIWVAGHRGMVGSALMRRLDREDCELLTVERYDLDLTRQEGVERWVDKHRPEVIVLCAARVGGILANNTHPVEFLYDNLMIATNVIRAAHLFGVQK